MLLTEKHIIKKSHVFYNECDSLCFKSKNIYNQGLYNIRQHYFENKVFLNYYDNYHITTKQECYKELPTKVFCQTLKMLNDNFSSFFVLLKNKEIKARIPKYLDKIKGRYITKFPKQALGFKIFKLTGRIHLSQTNINVKTQIKDFNLIKEVRIIPRNNYYVIEVVYEKECKTNINNNKIASIDPGLNNLATVTFNDGSTPYIINGRPLKSINQYYNKEKSKYTSILTKQYDRYKSKRIERITNKRNNKIDDYLHKSSRILVNQLVKESVGKLIIGKNTGQKQDVNMGKVNNQNFVEAPVFKFLNMVKYKCELEGIEVIFQEESYTSRASFLNLDYIPIYGEKEESTRFSGYRQYRGLYKLKGKKMTINADVNGSYNILRKAIPDIFSIEGIEGFGVIPIRLN